MRITVIGFAIPALLGGACFGQTASAGQATTPAMQDRLLRLTHTATVPEFQEIANLVRTLAEIRDVSADSAQMTLAVHATDEQVGLAEWLVKELDQPVGGPPPATSPEYKGLSDTDEQRRPITNGVARIFYLQHAATVQDFQEAVNAIRTVTEIRRVFTYNDGRAMAVRGTPHQLATAEWLVRALDQPSLEGQSSGQRQRASSDEYRVGDDDVMRVLQAGNTKSAQDFQEIANTVRTIVEIRRLFTVNTSRAVLVRSTSDQMAMAQWLLGELDKPADAETSRASSEYRVPDSMYPLAAIKSPHDEAVRVFYVAGTKSVQEFQAVANAVHTAAGIRQIFTYNPRRAVAVRGTPDQLALAEKLIHDLDHPRDAARP
jgi:type II secretory pathway component GspD/PulD (secretin)